MGAEDWVIKANNRLRGCGVTLEVSGKNHNLYLRGMFPDKPWLGDKVSQKRIALKMRAASAVVVREAETVARQVALDLTTGAFSWSKLGFLDPRAQSQLLTVGDLINRFEEKKRGGLREYTWKYSYENPMATLPRDLPPSEELFVDWILENDPNCSTMRRKYLSIAKSLCKIAGISTLELSEMTREHDSKAINPRLLPTDAEIEATGLNSSLREWRWVYAMLAVYGLRPHELFHMDLSRFPDVRILAPTKTGERLVPPVYPRWVELFGLNGSICLPSGVKWDDDTNNWRLGRKIAGGFRRHGLGKTYNLRHCYARRCLEVGMTSDISAGLMGHSRLVHEQSYRAFIHSSTYLDVAKRITSGL